MENRKIRKSTHQKLLDISLIALFAALCYVALTVLFIPFATMYIHFGNLIVVLAALLIGGWQGGLAGSLGMGLFDVFNGHLDSSPKTFIMKLLIGLTVGLVYKYLKNRKNFPKIGLFVSGGISLLISAAILYRTFSVNQAYTGRGAILFPIFLIIGLLCVIFGALETKLPQKTASAVIGASLGMLVNLAGETAWKIVTFCIAGSNLKAAVAGAVFDQASTLINAGIAIFGGVALFCLLEKPFSKITGR